MSKYGGVLKGMQYIDAENRQNIKDERSRRLEDLQMQQQKQQMEYQQFQMNQAKDAQQKDMFNNQMKPLLADKLKNGILLDDVGLVNQANKMAGLPKMNNMDVIQEVTEADRAGLVKQGILKPGSEGLEIGKVFYKGIKTTPDGKVNTQYIHKGDLLASLGLGEYITEKEQKSIIDKLSITEMQQKVAAGDPNSEDNKLSRKVKLAQINASNATAQSTLLKAIGSNVKKENEKTVEQKKANYDKFKVQIRSGEKVDTTTPEYQEALAYELNSTIKDNKLAQKDLEDLNNLSVRIPRSERILERIKSIPDESFQGQINNYVAKLKDVFTETKEIPAENLEETLVNRIGMESELAGYLADLIKEQSGAAVNESEVQRKLKELVGGDLTLVNKGTVVAAFTAHTQSNYSKLGDRLEKSTLKLSVPLIYQHYKDLSNTIVPVANTQPVQTPPITAPVDDMSQFDL